jgi:hypothetical protein
MITQNGINILFIVEPDEEDKDGEDTTEFEPEFYFLF